MKHEKNKKLSLLILTFSIFLLFFIPNFSLADIEKNWQSDGIKIAYTTINNNTILKTTSTEEGFNTLFSQQIPMDKTLKYSFLIKGENTGEVLAGIAYFDENKKLQFTKKLTLIGKGSFGWKNVEIFSEPSEDANFYSLAIIIINKGIVYLDKFIISEFKWEKPKGEDIQKLVIDNEEIVTEIFIKKTYSPGDDIRTDFYVTNKKGILYRIDTKLKVYYSGIKVLSYERPSTRQYNAGKTIHISDESKIPLIALPGKYTLKFYITPLGRETKEISTSIIIKSNVKWYLFVTTLVIFLTLLLFLIKRHWNLITGIYERFSIGQKFIALAIIGLIISAIVLVLELENYANNIAIIVYYFLVIGFLNELVEYLRPKWDRKK